MSQHNQVDPAAFTVKEFLSWARISHTKFYDEVGNGRIVPRKCGKRTLVLRTDAEEWLNNLPTAA